MENRKLASVRKISNIEPIPNADNIVLATVDGWKSITKKDEFNIGDLCVYCEVDSFLPIREEFEFLRKSSYKKMNDTEGFKLKSMKLRGVISQGLILPISVISIPYNIGDDVSEHLGIVKYEEPIPTHLGGLVKGNFPSFLIKTDEERIQNLTNFYESWKDERLIVTEKLDGSSITIYLKDGSFGVCSRRLELEKDSSNSFWKAVMDLDIENKLKSLGLNIALQGELIGGRIQGNPYKINGITIRFFYIYDIDSGKYYDLDNFIETISKLGLETVPIIDTDFRLPNSVDELLKMADGKSLLCPTTNREGFVISSFNKHISFKVISNNFLLTENK